METEITTVGRSSLAKPTGAVKIYWLLSTFSLSFFPFSFSFSPFSSFLQKRRGENHTFSSQHFTTPVPSLYTSSSNYHSLLVTLAHRTKNFAPITQRSREIRMSITHLSFGPFVCRFCKIIISHQKAQIWRGRSATQ